MYTQFDSFLICYLPIMYYKKLKYDKIINCEESSIDENFSAAFCAINSMSHV